jgi:hypothetical protein
LCLVFLDGWVLGGGGGGQLLAKKEHDRRMKQAEKEVCACARACVRASVCVRACVCVRASASACVRGAGIEGGVIVAGLVGFGGAGQRVHVGAFLLFVSSLVFFASGS